MLLPLHNKPWLSSVVQAGWLFAEPSRDAVYERCVDAALDEPSRARKLGKRPGTTRLEVSREMRIAMYRNAAYTQADGPERMGYDKAVVGLERARGKQQAAADESEWDWRVVCSLLAAASLGVLIFGGFLTLLIAVFIAAVLVFVLFWRGTAVWFNLRHCLHAGLLGISCAVARAELGYHAVVWGAALFVHALEHFAHQPAGQQPAYGVITDDARQLIDEAAAYSYFSLTLLEIITAPGLDRRSERAATQGPYGAHERLAEARLELGISPYSARTFITHIRKAWGLNDSPSNDIMATAWRQMMCPLHGSRPDAFGRRRSG
jgi:hypothetical protein